MNRLGLHILMVDQLGRPENERQKMVIIKTPNSMGSSRLQIINQLQFSHQFQIPHKNSGHHSMVILLFDLPQSRKAIQPGRKICFMTSTVIDSASITKTIGKIRTDLDGCRMKLLREKAKHQGVTVALQSGVPSSVGDVTVTAGLLDGRDFFDPLN